MSSAEPKEETSPPGEVAKKSGRTQMTPLQKEVLEASYTLNPFPAAEHKRSLGERIGLDEKQISTWFSGRRRKDKKTEDGGMPGTGSAPVAAPDNAPAAAPPAAPVHTPLPQSTPAPHPAQTAAAAAAAATAPPAAATAPAQPPPALQPAAATAAAPQPPHAASSAPTPLPSAVPAAPPPGGLAPQHASAAAAALPAATVMSTAGGPVAPGMIPPLSTLSGPLPVAAMPGLLPHGMAVPQQLPLQPLPGGPLPASGAVQQQQQQQQQLIQLLQQQPQLLQQQPQLLQAIAQPQLLQHLLVQQQQQQQQRQGIGGIPSLVPLYPAPQPQPQPPQQQPQHLRPNLPPLLAGLPGLGIPSSSLLQAQPQPQPQPQQQQQATGLEGLPAEALHALQEAAKSILPQPFREDGPPLAWDFDELPQAAVEAGVGGKHKRSEPFGAAGGTFKVPRTSDMGGVLHKGIPPLSSADKSRLRAEEKEQRRLDAIKERERKNEEKRKEREDKKRERELMRATERQEKAMSKAKAPLVVGPPDDLDLEWSKLLEEQRQAMGGATAAFQLVDIGGGTFVQQQHPQPPLPELPPPERPEFPPVSLDLSPAFTAELGPEVGVEVLMVTAFLHSFADVLGMAPPPSADQVAQAVFDGQDSLLLGAIHIAMLRLVQADMEEAHASGAASVSAAGPGSAGHHFDRAMISAAHMLEGCWGWGFDMDAWRAHLNALTWPEVLRQLAVVGTSGSPLPKPGRGRRPSNVHKVKMGVEGEDVVEDEHGNLKLRLPNRLGVGTVKAASWQVLAEVGPEGLAISEMASRIHESGLRDFKYTKQPEATVAGALARDVLFTRVGPAQYALSSIIKHRLNVGAAGGQEADAKLEGMDVDDQGGQRQGNPEGTEEGDSADDDDEEGGGQEDRVGGRTDASQPKAPWVGMLAAHDYDVLNVGERLAALAWLIHIVCDCPTVRLLLDARVDQAANDKREILEIGKEIKRRRQQEAQDRSRAAAEVASKKMAEMQLVGGSLPGCLPPQVLPLNFDPQIAAAASAAAQKAMEEAAVASRLVSEAMSEDTEEERAARQQRIDALSRVDEETAIQLQPLGLDRRYNRYWRIAPAGCDSGDVAQGARDPGVGRVFVEAADGSSWRLVQRPEQLDALVAALEPRGVREGPLASALQRLGPSLKQHMPSAPLTIDLRGGIAAGAESTGAGPLPPPQRQQLAHQLALLRPQAALFYPGGEELPQLAEESVRLSKLKKDVLRVGAALPASALHFDFDRAVWQQAVQQAHTPVALRQCVGRLEGAVVPAYLSAAYNRNPQILKAAWSSAHRQQQEAEAAAAAAPEGCAEGQPQPSLALAMEEPLSWLPPTYAAVALRFQALDAALYFAPDTRCGRDRLAGYKYILRPAPVVRPSTLELLRQQMQHQQQGQPVAQEGQQGGGTGNRCDVTHSGMLPIAYGGTLTAQGRLKPALFFPELPLTFMSCSHQVFKPPIEQLRAAVDAATAAGTLMPVTSSGGQSEDAAVEKGRGGRAAAATQQAAAAGRSSRVEAMVRASAAVRSLASRVASARGSSKHDKFAKARSHKAKKVRQSNLSKQWAREKGGVGSEDDGPDYGEGYDDGFDEQMEAMLGPGGAEDDGNGDF